MEDVAARQAAVNERRQWVRLTRACNNHCIFCHDVGAHDGLLVPDDEVLARLRAGRESGATRAILSGGEPTIHPRFLDLVKSARDMGYTWVQCVSNGRMFAYDAFTARAMNNGLREATLSMHGHTPELFERLVGIPGSFRQSLQGLKNLLRMGAVVSVDVVLNRQNLPHLRELLQFYIDLGVGEFDLLHLVPFGRGFDEHRDELFEDPDVVARELARALTLVDEVPGLFLWTNRLPIELLEGHEELFQDPHKLYDEVLGERTAFKELFANGTAPDCLGERCPWCFLRPFCDAARQFIADRGAPPTAIGAAPPPERTAFPERAGVGDGFVQETLAGAEAASGRSNPPERAGVGDGFPQETLAGAEAASGRSMEADRAFCESARGISDAALRARAAGGLRAPLREGFGDAVAVAPTLDDLDAVRTRLGVPIDDLPPCLGGPIVDARPPEPPPDDLAAFVSFFIRNRYRVKSLRCRTCRHDGTCPGLQVNLARHWGLRALRPEA